MSFDFARQITEHQQRMYGYIHSLVGNSTVSWDILQETNIILWSKRAEFRPGSNFGAWARAIAHFQVLGFIRDRQREPLSLLTPELMESFREDAETVAGNYSDRLVALNHCREELGDKARELIDLHYENGLPMKEVGSQLRMSTHAVKQAIYRVRQALRDCVQTKLSKPTG